MKATPAEIQLIKRLTEQPQDAVAVSELFSLYYKSLIDRLKRQYPKVDEDEVYETAFQTIDQFVKAPHKFDPEKKSLKGYLEMDAKGNLLNLLQKSSREKTRVRFVEDWESYRNKTIGDVPDKESEEEVFSLIETKLRGLFSDELDLTIARMMEMGIRETTEYAKVLRLDHLPVAEQRQVVKRQKDRISKQLNRSDWDAFKKRIRDQYL